MSLEGNWQIHQDWGEGGGYNFPAQFGADGSIHIVGGFFGTWTVLGTSNQVALALESDGIVTSFAGNVSGNVMTGQTTRGKQGSPISHGTWSGVRR